MGTLLEFRSEALPVVRIGLIGVGRRGMKTLERYAFIRGAEIRCVADVCGDRLHEANERLRGSGRSSVATFEGDEAWRDMCRCPDIDLIYICTDWSTHCKMAVEAMRCGKHVAVEVPAATTVEECRLLVETAERTRRHCFMTENCCYDFFALSTLEMERVGLFGEVTHCEGAYIHNLHEALQEKDGGSGEMRSRNWMERKCERHGGNPYPTHGIGPIGWLLNLHRGDRMDYLVSMTSFCHGAGQMHGKVNSTLIKTVKGRTILLQLDVTTPRPYSRLQTVCGTDGFAQKYPEPVLKTKTSSLLVGEAAVDESFRHLTSHAASLWKQGHELGVPNEMNYAMDARLVYCLRKGLPLDIDVYDAAEWSCLAELSELSASQGGCPVRIPDFTNGHWQDLSGHTMYF